MISEQVRAFGNALAAVTYREQIADPFRETKHGLIEVDKLADRLGLATSERSYLVNCFHDAVAKAMLMLEGEGDIILRRPGNIKCPFLPGRRVSEVKYIEVRITGTEMTFRVSPESSPEELLYRHPELKGMTATAFAFDANENMIEEKSVSFSNYSRTL